MVEIHDKRYTVRLTEDLLKILMKNKSLVSSNAKTWRLKRTSG